MMRTCFYLICFVLSAPWFCFTLLGQDSRADANWPQRLQQVNLKLKKGETAEEILKMTKDLWLLIDEHVLSSLNESAGVQIDKVNEQLDQLQSTKQSTRGAVERLGWSAHVKLYSVGNQDLLLAVYQDYYWTSSSVSTFRLLRKRSDGWQVVGRMEETDILNTLAPLHRAEVKIMLENMNPNAVSGYPDPYYEQAEAAASQPMQMNHLLPATSTIQVLPKGGIRFTSLHMTDGRITAYTLVEWEWTSEHGLRAVSWIWGDQWKYDEGAKSNAAEWLSDDPTRKGKTVKLRDYLP